MTSRGSLVTLCFSLLAGCAPLEGDGPGKPSGPLDLPPTAYNYAEPDLPRHFTSTVGTLDGRGVIDLIRDRTPEENPVTDEGATLGRVLFFDPLLSKNQTINCASCHRPEIGFSDDAIFSEGFDGGETGRHSMGLSNARFTGNGRYFWDERAPTLEAQVLMPIQDSVEMGMTLEEVTERISETGYYQALFADAFGDEKVTAERISHALAQFVRSLLSYTAPYDVGRAEVNSPLDDFPSFSVQENQGKRLFFASLGEGGFNCVACHLGEAFAAPISTSNGLDEETTDPGVGGVSGRSWEEGRFRVASLRNIAVRPPYMHDGRFADLDEVLAHYSTGVEAHHALSVYVNPDGTAMRFDFSDEEHDALKAFLHTLTDETMMLDPKFQDPFQD
jgi:cytochrome c peroxidase